MVCAAAAFEDKKKKKKSWPEVKKVPVNIRAIQLEDYKL